MRGKIVRNRVETTINAKSTEQCTKITHSNIGRNDEQAKGFYTNRALSCNCYYRAIDVDTYAGDAAGKKTGKDHYVSDKSKTMGTVLFVVHRRL